MMTMGSLFDGIGGFPLAAARNGVTPVWASEIESFPIEVTKIRFPDMLHVGDITKLNGATLPPVDVICGGSPCQDLSVAGARRGLAGERSGLFMEQTRIAKEMRKADEQRGTSAHLVRPRYLVWENVPGAFSSAEGEDFRAVIEEIVRIKDSSCDVPRPDTGTWQSVGSVFLGAEFSLAWRVLNAQYWGVAQRRRRIFLVADFGGLTAPEILFKQDSLLRDTAQSRGEGQGTADSVERCLDDTGGACLTPWDVQSRRIFEETGIWPALYGGGGGGHGYISTEEKTTVAFAANQRDEVRDLHNIAALGAQPSCAAFCSSASADACGIGYQDECSPTIKTGTAPAVLCLNDQGGNQMQLTDNITGTLRAQEHGHQPLVIATQQGGAEIGKGVCPAIAASAGMSGSNQPVLFENHGIDSRYTGPHTVSPTMSARMGTGGNNVPLVGIPVAFSPDSKKTNSMKSANPHSSCRETDVARTIDTTNTDPSKNQGGIAILQETMCIAGNTIDRQPQNGGNGLGCQPDVAYTLTATDHHAVFNRYGYSGFGESDVVGTQCARQYKDATDLISTYQKVVGALCSGDVKGIGNQYVSQDKCIIDNQSKVFGQSSFSSSSENGISTLRACGVTNCGRSENLTVGTEQKGRNLIRRLTPLECERLQGFPDGWTLIPNASDSARYKALGNSVAIPCVEFLLRGIAYFLHKIKEDVNGS